MSTPINSISVAARLTLEGINDTPFTTSLITHSCIEHSPRNNSYIVLSKLFLSTPNPLVVFPWGSVSITNIFLFLAANAADKLIEVVVFPTPPF